MGGDGHHGRRQWHAARAAHEASRVAEQGSVGWEAERSGGGLVRMLLVRGGGGRGAAAVRPNGEARCGRGWLRMRGECGHEKSRAGRRPGRGPTTEWLGCLSGR
jgi:hypothetical protein